ncbi:MAG: hypothetical protein QG612_1330 [Pseudomonadota bacterium]|jgi:hypothetical protein|nr:hypothetical protein [Pseudomonadota bacterium]
MTVWDVQHRVETPTGGNVKNIPFSLLNDDTTTGLAAWT